MADGLWCEGSIPLVWRQASLDASARQRTLREAGLLLNAFNQMESMPEAALDEGGPGGSDKHRLGRMEAKLDLALNLLARVVEPESPVPARLVRLSPEHIAWEDEAPPAEGTPLLLELHPSHALPLALRLPAVALAPETGMGHALLADLPEGLRDALHQFVFRRHRQAIRDKNLARPT